MNVLFYATIKDGVWECLQHKVEAVVPVESMEICRTIESLSERLCKPLYGLSIGVMLATSQKELQELLIIRDFIIDFRLILVLPDRKKETIAKGHLLRPRYLTYADGDFTDVAAVLGKMLEFQNKLIC